MSKGLGKLQRDILDCLGSPGCEVEKGVYDLRRVARYVECGDPALAGKFALPFYPSAAFSAAFSRAVRSLIRRGELERVPFPNWRDEYWSRQTRLVRRPKKLGSRLSAARKSGS